MDFHHQYQRSQCHSCFVRLVRRLWINPWRREITPLFFFFSCGGIAMMHVQISWLQDEGGRGKKNKTLNESLHWKFSVCWYNSQVCLWVYLKRLGISGDSCNTLFLWFCRDSTLSNLSWCSQATFPVTKALPKPPEGFIYILIFPIQFNWSSRSGLSTSLPIFAFQDSVCWRLEGFNQWSFDLGWNHNYLTLLQGFL